MNKDYKKLILVAVNDDAKKCDAKQSNKFYEMLWDGSPTFTVKYGRVEATSTTISYPYSQWDRKYNEKIRKGYKDVTEFVTIEVTEDKKESGYSIITDNEVHKFMELLRKYRDNLVSTTYSVKAELVSQKQVDKAQELLDNLKKLKKDDESNINIYLMALYSIIPRKMSHVKNHIMPNIDLDRTLLQEQDNLDAMASQVSQNSPKKTKKGTKIEKTILDELGITMTVCNSNKEIKYLVDQIGKSGYNNVKLEKIFRINKKAENETFEKWLVEQKDKSTRILIHGTRCSSVIPILDIGLKIRPVGNFQFSGKAYGDGNYFSETVQKSLGYTGWQEDKILLVYEVHTGKPFIYDGWYKGNSFALNYNELQQRGFDSTFVMAGNGLLNSEIIAYKEQQNRLKYIIWLK